MSEIDRPFVEVQHAHGGVIRRKKFTAIRLLRYLLVALLVIGTVTFLLHLLLPRHFTETGKLLPLTLTSGAFQVSYYCSDTHPKGVAIVGTGDGGISYWEENTAKSLAAAGYAVGVWDCRKFADSRDYNFQDLCEGFESAVTAVKKQADLPDAAPVWYGGWSTGAEQSLAAAASPSHPVSLKGLWLAAPGERGRFGITTADLLGKTPQGEKSFDLAEMSKKLGNLAVVQFIAALDPLDNPHLLDQYTGHKKVVRMSSMLHDMGGAGDVFQRKLLDSFAWTLEPR